MYKCLSLSYTFLEMYHTQLLRWEVWCSCRSYIHSKIPRTDVRSLMQLSAQHSCNTTKDRRNTSEDIPRDRSQQHVPMDPFQMLYAIKCTYRICIEYLLGLVLYHLHRKDKGHLAIPHWRLTQKYQYTTIHKLYQNYRYCY
jgi:hypothetical protein